MPLSALRARGPTSRLPPQPRPIGVVLPRMSVDPDQPSATDPTPKPPVDSGGESAEALRLKRRFKRGATESEEGEKPDQTIELLSTLLQDLIAKKEQPGAPEPEPKTAKYHRLSKTGSGVAGTPEPNPPVASAPSTAAAPAGPTISDPSPPPLPPPVTFRPAPIREPAFRLGWLWSSLIGVLALLALTYLTVVYFRSATMEGGAGTKLAPAPVTVAWNDAMLSQLDQALAADPAGDLKGARRIASSLVKPDGSAPPGLVVYLASINVRLARSYDVEADLMRAISGATPEAAARFNEALAFSFSRSRDFDKAADFFKVASRLDPFSAPLFYHWGEALRHLGRFQEAADVFRQALDRIPTGQPEAESLRDCINLKQRLTLIEQAREGEFQDKLTSQLAVPQPSGYWLLTAAAVALQHKNLPDAAGFLGRARDALGAVTFDEFLNDYFFRADADRKELADFFPSDPAARGAGLLPTMAYTVEP